MPLLKRYLWKKEEFGVENNMTEIGSSHGSIETKIKKAKVGIRRAVTITGMTAKTRLREDGLLGPERALDERVERGEMFRIIKRIRRERASAAVGDKGVWNERLGVARKIFEDLASKLDALNRQYYSPEYNQFVDIEVLGESVGIPVRRYSLRDKDTMESLDQAPRPIIIIGGATSGPTVTKGTAEAFALQYPNRDVYVIGYPDSKDSKISPDLPGKLREQGNLETYAKINKDVLLKMGFESFDLVGISMGGGIVLQAALDTEFAKRINNLVAISPTSIQETKGKNRIGFDFGREVLRLRTHPREWVRVPQKQPGYTLGSHEGMGLATINEIARRKKLSADDLIKLHVQGRVMIVTGDKDAVISCEQTKKETELANERRTANGERPIEFMQVLGGHHGLGVVQAAGLVSLVRNTDKLPDQINVKDVSTTTGEVFVREDPRLGPVVVTAGYP